MRKLLITGGAGFIGANFAHYWSKHHPDDHITVLDALTYAGNRSSLQSLEDKPNFAFIQGDICDETLVNSLLRNDKIDTIVHFAAESHVDRSIYGPDAFIQSNIVGTYTLLKCAKNVWLDKNNVHNNHFHHVSTDEVFGSLGLNDPAFTETTPYDPSSPYSASKAASDHLVRAYHKTYGLNITISNCSNNYGPYHFPEKLIPLTIINILNGKPIPIYGTGKNIRDWLFVTDHCHGIDLVIENGKIGETYNIGGNCERSNLDVVNTLCELIDKFCDNNEKLSEIFPKLPTVHGRNSNSLITFIKDRPGHDLRYAINTTKISNELSFSPKETFESGIRKTIQWYIDNTSWWFSLLDNNYKNWINNHYDNLAGVGR